MAEVEPVTGERSESQRTALGLWIALARCYSTYAKAIAQKVQEYDLTTPQFGALEALYHLGPLSLGELADKLLVTGGNVTYVMDRLEGRGLLTREGQDLVAEVFPGHADYVEYLCRHLNPREQEDMRRMLKALGKGIASNDLAP